ncbi:anthranilate synthase component I family protein [Bacteroidia bacterium]|nr:anthranilate synthase component I family protein [Bacteroidia bacterium]
MQHKITQYIESEGLEALKQLCYQHTTEYEYACVLDSCQLNTGVHGGKYELMAAYGALNTYRTTVELDNAIGQKKWLFGALGYDLKNNFEKLKSNNTPLIETPDLLFFEPQSLIVLLKNGEVRIYGKPLNDSFWAEKPLTEHEAVSENLSPSSEAEYIDNINAIHQLIRQGDVYELNYCVPHTHTFERFSPIRFQLDLVKKSPVPMASYLRAGHLHLCGASMERYLLKDGSTLTSQPIKGTIRKGSTPQEDQNLIAELEQSEKDRSENVMIVDLVRNDLNRICERGSVQVNELFGIYSYLQVHQMISTITGHLAQDITFKNILKATFPMGSMTGAPKIAAMQHIEILENFKRGWYSGSLGYITPGFNFDFNVVIRSVLCDMNSKTLNYNAGGAITIDSDPNSEWDEVKLKTKAISQVLGFT